MEGNLNLAPLKFGKIDEQPKVHQIFMHPWLQSHVNNEYQIHLEDIS